MEMANQYGINLAAIDQAVSAKKTAEQNIKMNDMQMNQLSSKIKDEEASKQADKDYMTDPKTAVATSIAQKLQWNRLDEDSRVKAAAAMKQHINQRGVAIHSIMQIQDPAQQQQAIIDAISKLPPEEQQEVAMKYGKTPQELQQNLPHMMNDLLVADGGVDLLQKQAEEEAKQNNALALEGFKHSNKLDEVNALYGKKKEINNDTIRGKKDTTKMNVDARKKIAEYKAQHGSTTGKPTVFDKKVSALVRSGKAKTEDEATLMIMNDEKTTNVNDPVMGNKVITSHKNYGNRNGGNKKPLDINKYIK